MTRCLEDKALFFLSEGEASEETPAASTNKPDKQIKKLLKVQANRQRRPGPELGPFKVLREVGLQEGVTLEKLELGKQFDASLFKVGESVDIVGTSKGKGFQGGVTRQPKRHTATTSLSSSNKSQKLFSTAGTSGK